MIPSGCGSSSHHFHTSFLSSSFFFPLAFVRVPVSFFGDLVSFFTFVVDDALEVDLAEDVALLEADLAEGVAFLEVDLAEGVAFLEEDEVVVFLLVEDGVFLVDVFVGAASVTKDKI